jgi:plastocyanin
MSMAVYGAKEKPDVKEAGGEVSIKKMKFSPDEVTVKPGEKVVWTNNDNYDHTVVADDGSFKSGNIGHGDTFEHKFEKKGKFKYSCTYHPRMKGVVIVDDKGK